MDVDGVCCDVHTPWIARYNEDFNDNFTTDKIRSWGVHKYVKPECGNRIYDYLHEDLYGLETPEIEGAREGLHRLRAAGDEIIFVTSCVSPGMFDSKVEWLRMKGLMIIPDGLIATLEGTSKLAVQGDVLIDDRAETVREFAGAGRIAVLFNQPWNEETWVPCRMESWREVGMDGIAGFLRRTMMGVAA